MRPSDEMGAYTGGKEVLQEMVGIRDTDGYRVVWRYRTVRRTIKGYAGLWET